MGHVGAPLDVPRRMLRVDDYRRMGEAGVFAPDERIELIEGELIRMAPIGNRHLNLVNRLVALLAPQLSGRALLSVQNPIELPAHSEPQPDIALLRPTLWQEVRLPTAADVLLVVEVADTTLAYDRDVKLPLYARHGIPEAWLVDAQERSLLVCREPTADGYRRQHSLRAGEAAAPLALPAATVALSELFD